MLTGRARSIYFAQQRLGRRPITSPDAAETGDVGGGWAGWPKPGRGAGDLTAWAVSAVPRVAQARLGARAILMMSAGPFLGWLSPRWADRTGLVALSR